MERKEEREMVTRETMRELAKREAGEEREYEEEIGRESWVAKPSEKSRSNLRAMRRDSKECGVVRLTV
jgi:hypothetical protein